MELTDGKPLTDYLYEKDVNVKNVVVSTIYLTTFNEKDVNVKNVVVSTIYLTTFSVLNALQQLMVCSY